MGLVSFALQGNYKRFWGDLKVLSKEVHKPAWWMFLDTAASTLLLGSGLQDYLNYQFYNKGFRERSTYVTVGYLSRVTPALANIRYSPFISNKVSFHKNYGKYTRRDFVSSEDSRENIEAFLDRHAEFVYKPQIGQCGEGVTKLVTAEITDRNRFYTELQATKACLEELVIQHEAWAALNPGSTNTLRIITGAAAGESWIEVGVARVGSGKSIADNFHMGGMAVLIDLETGRLQGNAISKKLEEAETSVTGVTFDGYPIPFWEEIKAMVLEAALVNDEIHFVGWDVAITPNGPLIIEGNRTSSFDLIQVPLRKGGKYLIEDISRRVQAAQKK